MTSRSDGIPWAIAWCFAACTGGAGADGADAEGGDDAAAILESVDVPDTLPVTDASDAVDDAADAEVAMPTCTTPCDDGDDCTVDFCNAAGNCQHDYTGTGQWPSCTDTNPCTFDVCTWGKGCTHEIDKLACDDGNVCTNDYASGTSPCLCVHQPLPCYSGNPCNTDVCDPVGGCTFTPNSDPCNDGDPCTIDDTCSQATCTGKPLSCDDGDKCTNDACATGFGCTHKAVCDDGNACTTDACDANTGACSHMQIPDGGVCNACSGAVCLAGACTGDTEPCFDSDPCTADSCDAKVGKCVHTAQPCVKPGTDDVCEDPNDCLCFGGQWPGIPQVPGNGPCNLPSHERKCSAGHRCYIEQKCLSSETKLNCGCVSNSQHYCPPNPPVPWSPVCPGSCMPPAKLGDAYTCSDWSSGSCPPTPTPGGACASDKDCPEASFCDGKNGCQPDTCNGGVCIDDVWPHGGSCFACATNGSGLIGDPFDCNDGDPCTLESWSPTTGCVHTAKAEYALCAILGTKICKKGVCVKP